MTKKNIKRITWKVEKRKIEDLKPHPKNPRQFTEKGMKDLENSINSIGFFQPVACNTDGLLLSGHARILKLKELGETEVDVMIPDRTLTPKQEEEVLVRANANTAGQWDFDLLANEFDDIELNDWGLSVPQISDVNLDDFFEENKDQNEEIKNKIVLEYNQEDYDILIRKFSEFKGRSKESVIFDLLVK